jgi:hypothetical protein
VKLQRYENRQLGGFEADGGEGVIVQLCDGAGGSPNPLTGAVLTNFIAEDLQSFSIGHTSVDTPFERCGQGVP